MECREDPLTWGTFAGVAAISPTDVLAMGQTTDQPNGAMSEHFNGTRWKILSVPPPSPDEPNLTPGQSGIDASSSTNAWIVTNGYNGTIDDHWDATTWTQVTSDTPTAAYFQVRGVSVLSDGTAFAVGWFQSTTTSRVRTLAEIYC